ncbi:hypothetical protein [Pleomorphovibrio marinus]|uniref:hypothetical protein n=1 Tax=Pleomorphovibrio marinus TaxID=2164132 RepID=UPI00130070F8|nr:hypothetical protein [Pleomorphovibrio marinus]
MIRQFFHSARFVLDIVLVLAAILLLYWWNPLGIFGGKSKLQPTANLTMEIKEMGELITAEYYGEVIASLSEARVNVLEQSIIRDQADACYGEIMECLKSLKEFESLESKEKEELISAETRLTGRIKRRVINREVSEHTILEKLNFQEEWEDYLLLPLNQEVLGFLFTNWGPNTGGIKMGLSDREKGDLLFKLYNDINSAEWDVERFIQSYLSLQQSELPNREARKKLAMVGRGSVKAGFDLTRLDENMYYINDKAGELHFFGLSPKILNADINPWFIPERGVPGFDILMADNGVSFKDAQKVKEFAIQKLTVNAQRADILKNAEEFGGETFKHLFTLITGKEIKKVVFHHDRLIELTQHITNDQFINYEEAKLFEELIQKELRTIDSLKISRENRSSNLQLAETKWNTITKLTQEVRKYPFEELDGNFNYFSTLFYEILRDSLIDDTEQEILEAIFNELKKNEYPPDSLFALWQDKDPVWAKSQFSEGMGNLIAAKIPLGTMKDTLFQNGYQDTAAINNFISTHWILRNNSINGDRKIFWLDTLEAENSLLHHTLFPFHYNPESWKKWNQDRNLVSSHPAPKDTIKKVSPAEGKLWLYRKDNPENLYQISLSFRDLFTPYFAEMAQKQGLACIGENKFCLFQETSDFQSMNTNPPPSLGMNNTQSEEMDEYINEILKNHQLNLEKGPVSRANAWVFQKLENKVSFNERLQKIKSKF